MVPICARHRLGGRVRRPRDEADQQPKYLNSPETPIYIKSRTLYGLNLTKAAIRKLRLCGLVEGYFDFAQVHQAGTLRWSPRAAPR